MGGGGLDVRMQGNGKQSQQRAMGPEMSCQVVRELGFTTFYAYCECVSLQLALPPI